MSDASFSNSMLPSTESTQQSRRNFLRDLRRPLPALVTAVLPRSRHNFLSPHPVLAQLR